jgi:hypothetical protein
MTISRRKLKNLEKTYSIATSSTASTEETQWKKDSCFLGLDPWLYEFEIVTNSWNKWDLHYVVYRLLHLSSCAESCSKVTSMMWDFGFSRQRVWRWLSSGLFCHIVWEKFTDISEVLAASVIIRKHLKHLLTSTRLQGITTQKTAIFKVHDTPTYLTSTQQDYGHTISYKWKEINNNFSS